MVQYWWTGLKTKGTVLAVLGRPADQIGQYLNLFLCPVNTRSAVLAALPACLIAPLMSSSCGGLMALGRLWQVAADSRRAAEYSS